MGPGTSTQPTKDWNRLYGTVEAPHARGTTIGFAMCPSSAEPVSFTSLGTRLLRGCVHECVRVMV